MPRIGVPLLMVTKQFQSPLDKHFLTLGNYVHEEMLDDSYIATIRQNDRRSWIFHEIAMEVASWPLQYFSEEDISKARRIGIHDFLDFQGKVVLSSVANDDLLVKWHQRGIDWYLDVVEELNPDFFLTIDTYVYLDAPRWEREYQLEMALSSIVKTQTYGNPLSLRPVKILQFF